MAKILIVEDAQDQLELFAKSFRRAGFDVYGAHDGGHAMDRVRDIRPDIILLDQMMPEVDGTTFLQNLRRFPKYKGTPVILVTGINDKNLKSKAASLGVATQHDLTLTFGLEWRFGAHPRSYWPWNPSRHIW